MKLPHFLLSSLIVLYSQFSMASNGSENDLQPDFDALRAEFLKVEDQLRSASYEVVEGLIAPFKDYPLYPYLEYQAYQKHMRKLSQEDINQFLDDYPLFPRRERLQRSWLKSLANRRQWKNWLVAYERLPIQMAEHQCDRARALLATGKKEQGYALAESLWTVGKSQPDGCNPLFDQWMKQGNPTKATAAKRYWLAAEAGEMRLARYLHRYMSKADIKVAQSYERLRSRSRKVAESDLSAFPESAQTALLVRAFKRVARGDAEKAAEQWLAFRNQLHQKRNAPVADLITDEVQPAAQPLPDYVEELDLYIGKRLAYVQSDDAVTMLQQIDPEFQYQELTESRLRQILAAKTIDWVELNGLIDRLPESKQNSDRWRYWRAKALDALGIKQPVVIADSDSETPEQSDSNQPAETAIEAQDQPDQSSENQQPASLAVWQQLAKSRSFYGFLAADQLGLPHSLNNETVVMDSAVADSVRANIAIKRAKEWFALERWVDARRDWLSAKSSFEANQKDQLAALAMEWGWAHQAIMEAVYQQQWNFLDARFPALYEDEFAAEASKRQIDALWATAIARQESAFKSEAQSPVGARGLMQLMPSTARQTARKHGVKLKRTSQLYDPSVNIALGSAYLGEMLKRFDGNRAYASAAYNAGPHRVSEWLEERGHLPLDAWMETIPFEETRNYVQNVLAFRVVYAERAGIEVSMLSDAERSMLAYQQELPAEASLENTDMDIDSETAAESVVQ